ncbi:rod shape-determining protein [Streptomyces diacarni]|uniref:rod shape-determining protein n=1 Tax=Streptomyces diacarni TaxID=2800381 RepID=UPI0033DD9591
MTASHRVPPTGPGSVWPLCLRCSGVALDLGSARTRALVAGRQRVLDVPTVAFPGTSASRPIQRGTIVDTAGTARLLDRMLSRRLPRFGRPLVVLTAPVLDGVAYRNDARTAVEVLRPRTVLTIPTARAVALAAGADLSRPLLVVDIGAHLTEAVLLARGAVFDARRAALGTGDLDGTTTATQLIDAVATMVGAMREQDGTSNTADALERGVVLAGGGALSPGITPRLAEGLGARVTAVPAPHTAAVRGAATLLRSARNHPSLRGTAPPATPAN